MYGQTYITFDNKFQKKYDENSDEGYIFDVHAKYPRQLHDSHNDLPFLFESVLVYKEKYVVRIRTLKQALNH